VRISVVADVHGNYDALAAIAERADKLVVLGDLLDYIDYHEPARGIVGEMFGAAAAARFAQLRVAGDFTELHRYNAELWAARADPVGELSGIVQARYRRVLDAVGPDALIILGNVDVAEDWDRVAGDVLPCRDAESVEVDGVRFGFVAGGASRHPRPVRQDGRAWRPFVRPADEYRAAVAALGDVDVLCSHIPPDIPLLRYDVVPAGMEMCGPGLLEYVDRHHPAAALFGHVHQPLAPRARRGITECINVGHFQRAERAFVLDLDRLPRRGASAADDAAFARAGSDR
jgi:Icc-related predicted phosphoesterase